MTSKCSYQLRPCVKAVGLTCMVCMKLVLFYWMMKQPQQLQEVPTCHFNISTVNVSVSDNQQLRRFVNRVLADFRPDLAERIRRLEAANASADNPEVIQLARDVIDDIPASTGRSPIKVSLTIDQTPQARYVDNVLDGMRDGFFVECGAFDGERSSNTNWLEKYRGWTGLLLEMDPFYYTQILGRNRRVWSANVCLSPLKRITSLSYIESSGQTGVINYESTKPKTNIVNQTEQYRTLPVPCFPLESLLLAINRTRVDYFSLDVEGLELEVLETIPWSEFDIRTLSVEDVHVSRGSKAVVDFMAGKGYRKQTELRDVIPEKRIFVNDIIFVKNN